MLRTPRTLLWRLCLVLIAIQVVVSIAFGTHAYRSARDFHHQQTLDTLRRLTHVLAESYVIADGEQAETLDRLVKHHGREAGVRITVIDAQDEVGQVHADSHREPATMDNHAGRPEVRAALEGTAGTSTRFSSSVLSEMMYYAQPIIQSVVTQFENASNAKHIEIETDVPTELAAPINRQLIEQALANYVSNAIKYSPPETTVTIRAASTTDATGASHDRSWVTISVSDQSSGIASEHLPRIFERFYRVDKARSRELGGTGLGLAIVKHIALVHGGRVDVESHVDRGSTFRIFLPG